MPGHFPTRISGLIYPPTVFNRVFLHMYFVRVLRTYMCLWTAVILKGCRLLRMRRGAGCSQPNRRQPPAVTNNRLARTWYVLVACNVLLRCSYHTTKKIATPSGQCTCSVCTLSYVQSSPGWCFNFQLGLHVLSFVALSYLGRPQELTFMGAIY